MEFAGLAKYLFALRLLRGVLPLVQVGRCHLPGKVLVGRRRRVARGKAAGWLWPKDGRLVALVVGGLGTLALSEFAGQQTALSAELLVLYL